MLPESLRANDVLAVSLPTGEHVALPLCTPRFDRWTGAPLAFTLGDKPTVEHGGLPVWAEFKVAELFRDAGWDALVIQTYGGLHFLRSTKQGHADRGVDLPESARQLFSRIAELNGGHGGFFDVLALRGDEVVFAEVKLQKRDRLRGTQKRWISSALQAGVPLESLLVVEWTLAVPGVEAF